MVKRVRNHHRLSSRLTRPTSCLLPSYRRKFMEKGAEKKLSKPVKKDWEDAVCSVCMEFPHNAVLLLCSSYNKGCRPYMCGTSFRYSNCLQQFKKAYAKALSPTHVNGSSHDDLPYIASVNVEDAVSDGETEKCKMNELACPLCRGQLKGWAVVQAARKYLNAKKRGCVQDDCSFTGTYPELRKHMKAIHPSARPREVDPILEQNWERLEHDREREDVLSTITSSMPGAMVLGDYVIEQGPGFFNSDDENEGLLDDFNHQMAVGSNNLFNVFMLLQAFRNARSASFNSRLRRLDSGASVRSAPSGNASSGVDGESELEGRSERRRRRRNRRELL